MSTPSTARYSIWQLAHNFLRLGTLGPWRGGFFSQFYAALV